ncbi:MAG: CHAT domain-containing protein [Cyanobium sp.]
MPSASQSQAHPRFASRDRRPPGFGQGILLQGLRRQALQKLLRSLNIGRLSPADRQRVLELVNGLLRLDGGRQIGDAALYTFDSDAITILESHRLRSEIARRLSGLRALDEAAVGGMGEATGRTPIRTFRESNLRHSLITRPPVLELSVADAETSFISGENASLAHLARILGLDGSRYSVPSIGQLSTALQRAGAHLRVQWGTDPGHGAIPPAILSSLRQYRPAVLRLSVASVHGASSEDPSLQVDAVLIHDSGQLRAWRSTQSRSSLVDALRRIYRDASGDSATTPDSRESSALSSVLDPVIAEITREKVSTLIISADPLLLNVPFASLPTSEGPLGHLVAFSITPSLAVSNLMGSAILLSGEGSRSVTTVIAGSRHFRDGLAPLPMAEQEMEGVLASARQARLYASERFTVAALIDAFNDSRVDRIHLATHADTSLSGGGDALLYTTSSELPVRELIARVQRGQAAPLDLVSISACRSGLSYAEQELGIAGAAIQLGARSTIGSSWYVDDVATASLFVLFYRHLALGLPKAEALRLAQDQMRTAQVRVEGHQVLGPDGKPLLTGLSRDQQLRYRHGFRHPYFWSGLHLVGSPW